SGSIASHAARLGHLAPLTDCRQLVGQTEPAELLAGGEKQRRIEDVDRLGAAGPERREGRLQVGGDAYVGGLQFDGECVAHRVDRLHLRGKAKRRVAQQGETLSRGDNLLQDLQPLGVEIGVEDADPGGVAAGPGQTLNYPWARSSPYPTIGIVLVARWAARTAGTPYATITLAFAWTSDCASSGSRSAWPSASRSSRRILRPSTNPSAANASLNPVALGSTVSGVLMRRMPTSGRLSGFCANAGTATLSHRANAATRLFTQ